VGLVQAGEVGLGLQLIKTLHLKDVLGGPLSTVKVEFYWESGYGNRIRKYETGAAGSTWVLYRPEK
jgi:hypothetical protein